jgi:hypothetical protein
MAKEVADLFVAVLWDGDTGADQLRGVKVKSLGSGLVSVVGFH